MKVSSARAIRTTKILTIMVAVLSLAMATSLQAQAPYVIPYTIQKLAGGGKALTLSAPATSTCLGSSVTTVEYDSWGDGCQNTSTSIVIGVGQVLANIQDVGIDPQGNFYFLDLNVSNRTSVRRIDARSGVVTVAAGSLNIQSICGATGSLPSYGIPVSSYGDGCVASDGVANALGLHTSMSTVRGMAVAPNGDFFLADYQESVVQKISASTGIMTLVAGLLNGSSKSATSTAGFTGNGGAATSAEVRSPRGVGVDTAGNVYIADTGNNEIRMVSATTGIITNIAGSPTAGTGFAGDGGPATSALLATPVDVKVDASGNVFICDFGNARIRVVYTGGAKVANLISKTNNGAVAVPGYIYTILGGASLPAPTGGVQLATSVSVAQIRHVQVDAQDNVWVPDAGYNVVYFIDATTGYVRSVAGEIGKTSGGGCAAQTDAFGDNCPGTQATFNPNSALGAIPDANGNLFVADSGDLLLRKVVSGRDFPTVAAGTSATQTIDIHFAAGDGPSATNPFTIVGSTDFTVGSPTCTSNPDTTQDCLVPVTFKPSTGANESAAINVSTLLNGVTPIGVQGSGIAAEVALDPGTVTSVATGLKLPLGAAVDSIGNTYVADTGNNRVVAYSTTGTPTVLAGTGTAGYTGDGSKATLATLSAPSAVSVTTGDLVYIADTGNNVVRVVNPATGLISTVAGGATTVCGDARDTQGDGCFGTLTKFSKPAGLAADIYGNVYVSDTGNNIVREISPTGYVSLVAGGASSLCTSTTLTIDSYGDNCPATQATLSGPTGLAVDSNMNIYIADTGDNEIRKILATSGLITSYAGTGVAGDGGDGGLATVAQVSSPTGLAIDAAGNLYIVDTGNSSIRTVTANGIMNAIEGIPGDNGSGPLPDVGTMALNSPSGIAVLPSGSLIILDSGNNRLLADSRAGVSYNFGPTNIGASSPVLSVQETEVGSASATLGSPLFSPSGSSSYFTVTGVGTAGCFNGTNLTVGATCALTAVFSPTSAVLNQSATGTFTEQNTNAVNSIAPVLKLIGTGANLSNTAVTVVLTTPSVTPKYSVPFSVTATVAAVICNTTAPACYPTGSVTFFVDGQALGVATLGAGSSGSASTNLTISEAIPIGPHQIVAVYTSDTFYAGNTSQALSITIAGAPSTSIVSASPNPLAQFSALTFTATVGTGSGKPTGSFSFYAGTTLLGTVGIKASTGVATLADSLVAATITSPSYYQNFGLAAGTYSITAVYSGDANYSTSTSPAYSLVITALPQSFTSILINPSTGTASNLAVTFPGATTQLYLFVAPTNTLNGGISFSCTGMPANTDCGFSPSTLQFAPTALAATPQYTQVTFFTNVNPSVIAPNQSGFSESWLAMGGSIVLLAMLRRNARKHKWFLLLPALVMLFASSAVFSGCSNSNTQNFTTALGTYNVNVTATGPTGQSITLPVTFTVASPVSN